MRVVKTLSIAFVVVCACSAMAAATASADLFLASAAGLLLLASADNTQAFIFHGNELKCTALTAHGVTALRSLDQHATVSYTGCKASFGGGTVDEPIVALYLFLANGTVHILKPILIFVLNTIFGECHVTVEAQTLLGITYHNNASGDILLLANVKSIKSEGLGPACTYSLESGGTYTGNALVFVHGGTIQWHA